MKVATWNVNGIRAREAQLCDWLERDQQDVVCLQEIKARPDQVPERCRLAHYHAVWHIGQRAEERELFEVLLDGHLVDIARALDPDNPGLFTWWPPSRNMRQRNIGWRIDYILASRTIAERATLCTVLADTGTSDHAPIMMTTV
jgi:exonuclease III